MKKNKKVELKFRINLGKVVIAGFVLIFLLPFVFTLFQDGLVSEKIDISTALNDIREEKVSKAEVTSERITLEYKDGSKRTTTKEPSISFPELLDRSSISPSKVNYTISDQSLTKLVADLASVLLPLIFMAALFFFLLRAQTRGAQDIFSFGRSKAKLFAKGKQSTTFADVAGVDDAKKELEEIVDFLKNPLKYRKIGARTPKGVLLVGPAGVGKCVTGDTLIWTNKGLIEIQDIPRYYYVNPRSNRVHGAGLASFDPGEVESSTEFASHWYNLGIQETVKIRLKQGFSLEGTPEHPVVVMTSDGVLKFRKLGQIMRGDKVAIQYGRNTFGNLNIVDTDTAYLMGLLTGDGNMSHASRVGLTNVDDELITFFTKYVEERYPKNAITHREQSYLISSWDFKKYLYQMGMSYLLSFDKVIPPTILQAPKDTQVAFLQGLFDTDGSVLTNRATFEYTTVSEKMARQVQMILLNLGVVATLNVKGRKENGYHRNVYRITVTGQSFVSFGRNVGCRLTRKQKLIESHLSKMGRVNTNIDIIPGISRFIEESWSELSKNKLSDEKMSKTIDKVKRRGRVSRQVLHDYVIQASSMSINVPHLEYFRSLLEANLFFSEVSEKSYNEQEVYDFTVPKTHSFLGNGFVNHNTLLARAVAGEAGVSFFSMAGSEFMEMLVGVGASRVRDLFATAKAQAPAIIFIDEIDAIGRQRGRGVMGGHDEREQTLNQILVEMDGFTQNDNVIVMAATNRGDLLDPALLRPGRFDRRVVLDMPDKDGRLSILKIHAKNKKFASEINWGRVADRTVGFSGADLENMLNEAAILAARDNNNEIYMKDIEEAATKVKMGPAKRRLQSEMDRKITAYHEAGHAIVTHFLPQMDPVHRISIVARGMSLGHTLIPPVGDRTHETKGRLLDQLAAMLGGRAAEEVVFNEMTAGASNDIEHATALARAMVTDFGMSDLGPVNFDASPDPDTNPFGGSQISPAMQEKVDNEVQKVLLEARKIAITLVKKHRKVMDQVSEELLKKETLDRDEFEKIVGDKKEEKK